MIFSFAFPSTCRFLSKVNSPATASLVYGTPSVGSYNDDSTQNENSNNLNKIVNKTMLTRTKMSGSLDSLTLLEEQLPQASNNNNNDDNNSNNNITSDNTSNDGNNNINNKNLETTALGLTKYPDIISKTSGIESTFNLI